MSVPGVKIAVIRQCLMRWRGLVRFTLGFGTSAARRFINSNGLGTSEK